MSPKMTTYLRRHVGAVRRGLEVVEVGAGNVNGSIAGYFEHAEYRGLDIEPGPGVDIVVKDESWELGQQCDWIVSMNTFEHVANPWILIQSIANGLKHGGHALIVAPFSFPYHRHPIDAWRYTPDSMRVLAESAGLNVIAAYLDYEASALYSTLLDFGWLAKRGCWREAFAVLRAYPRRPPVWNCVAEMVKP